MRFASLFSVRWVLPLLLLVLALPLLGWEAVAAARQADRERALFAERLDALARVATAQLDAQVAEVAQTLALFGAVVNTTPDDAGANHLLMRDLAGRLPAQVVDLNVWTLDGQNAGALDPRRRRPGASVAYREFFIAALAEPALAVETPSAPTRSATTAVFARRIERDGHTVGVISATVNLQPLREALGPRAAVLGAVILVADARGSVLVRSIDAVHGTVGELAQPLVAQSDAHATVMRSLRTPWWVQAGWRDDMAPVVEARHDGWSAGAGLLCIAVLLAFAFGHHLARSMTRLRADVARFAEGRWAHRTRPAGCAETHALAADLDRMADAAARRETLLALSEESLADLYQNAPFGYYSLDVRGRFVRINDTALDWFGCTREEAIGRMSITDFMRAEGRAVFQLNFPRLMKENRVDNIEFDLVGQAGRVRRVVVSATAVRDAEGNFRLTRTAMHDLTDVRADRPRLAPPPPPSQTQVASTVG